MLVFSKHIVVQNNQASNQAIKRHDEIVAIAHAIVTKICLGVDSQKHVMGVYFHPISGSESCCCIYICLCIIYVNIAHSRFAIAAPTSRLNLEVSWLFSYYQIVTGLKLTRPQSSLKVLEIKTKAKQSKLN